MHAPARGEDRPAHIGEAAHEERSFGADDVVIGFKPSDEVGRAVLLLNLAEADKGVHLVGIAPHRLGELLKAAHLRVGLVFHCPWIALEPPQEAVKQSEARRIRVQRGTAGDGQEPLTGAHGARIGRRHRQALFATGRSLGEQITRPARLDPTHPVRRHIALHQPPRPLAPESEIVRRGQVDGVMRAEADVLP